MKRFSILIVVALAAAAVLSAAPACFTTGTITGLIAYGATGCQSQDKIFSNFAYTGTVSASSINVNLVLQTGSSDIHGWSFVPTTAWVNGFTLSYDVTVVPGVTGIALTLSKDQMNSGGIPNGITISDIQTVGIGTLSLSGVTGVETIFSNAYSLQTLHTSTTATVPTGYNLLSYEQDFFENSIPEPMSFVLIGSGLLGLGLLRRRMRG